MLTSLIFILGLSAPALAEGACCIDAETPCTIELDRDCSSAGGTYYGDDSTCDEAFVECPAEEEVDTGTGDPPTGACCLDETCSIMEEDPCKLALGTWFGADTDCDDTSVDCGTTVDDLGACCVEETCFDLSTAECEERGGFFYGLDTECTDTLVECDEPVEETGACCVEDVCYELTAGEYRAVRRMVVRK